MLLLLLSVLLMNWCIGYHELVDRWWELLLLLKVVEVWWIDEFLLCWCFNLKIYACLIVLKCIWPINIFGIKFWGLEWSKLGFWGWKGVGTRNILNCSGAGRLSVLTTLKQAASVLPASSKRASPEVSGTLMLKQAGHV
jgi:hypothetical protein